MIKDGQEGNLLRTRTARLVVGGSAKLRGPARGNEDEGRQVGRRKDERVENETRPRITANREDPSRAQ